MQDVGILLTTKPARLAAASNIPHSNCCRPSQSSRDCLALCRLRWSPSPCRPPPHLPHPPCRSNQEGRTQGEYKTLSSWTGRSKSKIFSVSYCEGEIPASLRGDNAKLKSSALFSAIPQLSLAESSSASRACASAASFSTLRVQCAAARKSILNIDINKLMRAVHLHKIT